MWRGVQQNDSLADGYSRQRCIVSKARISAPTVLAASRVAREYRQSVWLLLNSDAPAEQAEIALRRFDEVRSVDDSYISTAR